ncbi:MAG TPA: hypothetical protein VJ901_04225 [Thermoanaerobaculia bacterium]|nr:hypothetical protein [Thermoanaerobaculia bacterium]
MIPPLAVWVVGKVLEVPNVQRALHKVDAKFYTEKRTAGKRAANNRAWLAAGAAAIVLGFGMIARSTKR